MEFLQSVAVNETTCRHLAPTSDKFCANVFDYWGAGGVIFLAIPPLLFAIILAMYCEEIHYILLNSNSKDLRNSLLWILGTYPAILLLCTIAVFVPRSLVTLTFVCGIYLAYAEYKFYYMIVTFAGGTTSFVDKTSNFFVRLNGVPCCCLVCLPKVKNSSTLTLIAKWMIFQNVILTPFYGAVAILLRADLKLYSVTDTSAAFYLTLFNSISTLVCMYGFGLILRITENIKGMEKMHAIRGKTICITLLTFVTGFESLVFNILDQFNVFPCEPPFNFYSNRKAFSNYAVVLQVFIIGIVARRFYRRDEDIKRQAFLTDAEASFIDNPQLGCVQSSVIEVTTGERTSYKGTSATLTNDFVQMESITCQES